MERAAGGLDLVVDALACPVCGAAMTSAGPTLDCRDGHTFDVARQGYASLTTGRATAGDTAAMIEARERFLAAGHYDRIGDAVAALIPAGATGVCIDVGGGTGHHLARVLDARLGLVGLVLDTSKPAVKRAARAHPRIAAATADAWAGLPVLTGRAAVVLSVFAPRNPAETLRVLAPDGVLVVVTPTVRHLAELVEAVGLVSVDERKEERLARQLADFELERSLPVEYGIALDRRTAIDDVLMGPAGHHADAEEIARALADVPEPIAATVSVVASVFRRAAHRSGAERAPSGPGVGGSR